jgi:hypothetical protein
LQPVCRKFAEVRTKFALVLHLYCTLDASGWQSGCKKFHLYCKTFNLYGKRFLKYGKNFLECDSFTADVFAFTAITFNNAAEVRQAYGRNFQKYGKNAATSWRP